MFRDLTRAHQRLSEADCLQLLCEQTRGVLSVTGDDGYPYGMPMNYEYDEQDGCVWFHCGEGGHRADALAKCDKVSFCVYDQGTRKEGHWAYTVRSVIIFGRIEQVRDREMIEKVTRRISHRFTQDEAYIQREIDTFASRTVLLRLVPEHICGKRVKEA